MASITDTIAALQEYIDDEQSSAAKYTQLADDMSSLGHSECESILHDIAKEELLHHKYLTDMLNKLVSSNAKTESVQSTVTLSSGPELQISRQ